MKLYQANLNDMDGIPRLFNAYRMFYHYTLNLDT